MWKRQPMISAEVALVGPRRVAVQLSGNPASPEARVLASGAVALAAARLDDQGWDILRLAVVELAEAIADPGRERIEPVAHLQGRQGPEPVYLEEWTGGPTVGVCIEVVKSAAGLVPRTTRVSSKAAGALGFAALGIAAELASVLTGPDRLALAFTLEGVLAWLEESDRRAPARAASTFALDHATRRISEMTNA